MTFAPRAGAGPIVRSFTGVIATAVLLSVLALPAAAVSPVKLSRPSVTPANGTTATTFVLNVTYRSGAGAPDFVRVVIGSRTYTMVSKGGADWKGGVVFSLRTKLAAGEYKVEYRAKDGPSDDTLPGATIRVGRAPRPEATPDRSTDGSTAPKPTPRTGPSDGPAIPKPSSSPAPTPAGMPHVIASPEPSPGAGAGGPRPEPPGPANPSRPDGGGDGEATAGVPGSWGSLTRYLEALGLDPAGSPYLRLVPVMIWSVGGVALVMAFGFFGKRRRDGEPPEPDEVLHARAARGDGEAATAALVPEATSPALPIDAEMAMPRWRRPSLLQARKADPLRSGMAAARLSFDNAAVAPIAGAERRLIRYLVVQLLDVPDEFRGAEVGVLAQGDEVQLLERAGTYWRVLCPDGLEGWLHRMTLGDVVGGPGSPSAREIWATPTVEADDVDDDVLLAFMSARGRA